MNQRDLVGQIILSIVTSSVKKHLLASAKVQPSYLYLLILYIFFRKNSLVIFTKYSFAVICILVRFSYGSELGEDAEVDSLRFYYLGNKYQTKIEHIGVDRGTAADQVLIL